MKELGCERVHEIMLPTIPKNVVIIPATMRDDVIVMRVVRVTFDECTVCKFRNATGRRPFNAAMRKHQPSSALTGA